VQFLRANSLRTLTRNFGHDLAKKINPATGRLHGRLGLAQARTGRYTSSEPNLQNMPVGPFRRVFAAPEGRRILSADYSAIELRIACLLAGERTLVEVFRHPPRRPDGSRNPEGDPHQQVTNELRLDPRTNVKLRIAKALNYSTLYGSSAAGFANNAGISEDEAREHLDGYWKLRTELFRWQRNTNQETLETSRATTQRGREVTCIIPAKYSHKEPAVVVRQERTSLQRGLNVPIQGAAAELMLLAVYYVDQGLLAASHLDANLLLTVHDELVVEVAERDVASVADIMRQGMERAFEELFSGCDHFKEVAAYVVGEIDCNQTWGGERLNPGSISDADRDVLFKGLAEQTVASDIDDDDDEDDDVLPRVPPRIIDAEPRPLLQRAVATEDSLAIPPFLKRTRGDA
jgi:DNA polymerase-1